MNPFTGASWYVNPNYTSEVATSVGRRRTLAAQMTLVGQQPTRYGCDRIAAIYGGSGNGRQPAEPAGPAGHRGQQQHAGHRANVCVYDLPNRDCAALASTRS